MQKGNDGTVYVTRNAAVDPVALHAHEVSHVIDRALGNSKYIQAADAAVRKTLDPEAKARYVLYYGGAKSSIDGILGKGALEKFKEEGTNPVSKNADGTWAHDLGLSGDEVNRLANVFDSHPLNHIRELRADLRAHVMREDSYWRNFSDHLTQKFGSEEAKTVIGRVAQSFKRLLDAYRAAFKKNPTYEVKQLVKNYEEIVQAIARADAEHVGTREVQDGQTTVAEHRPILAGPYKTEKMAEMARAYRGASHEVVPVEGGFGVQKTAQTAPPDGVAHASFAGRGAATADQFSLDRAQEMLKNKASEDRVRRETGWFKGVDGKWRFEISDDEAKLTNPPIYESFQNYLGAREKEKYGEGFSPSSLKGSAAKEYADFTNQVESEYEDRNGARRLKTLLDHPKLYAAYPRMENMLVRFPRDAAFRGAYYPQHDMVDVRNSGDHDQMFSTLMHEVQHAIQHHEDFATGGNADSDFTKAVKTALGDLTNRSQQEVEQWKWANKFKIDSAEEASRVARYGLMYESAQRLIDYANKDRPSGVLRLIRNEMQWIYDKDFRKNEDAIQLQRDWWNLPKAHRVQERNAFLSDMSFRAGRVLLDAIPPELRTQFKEDPRTMKGMLNSLRRESERKHGDLAPLRDLEKNARDAQSVEEAHKYSTPFEVYQALAGEVESRNTQARLKMTDAERRDSNPEHTADVPLHKTVVMFGGLDIQAPRTAFSKDQEDSAKFSTVRVDGAATEKRSVAIERVLMRLQGRPVEMDGRQYSVSKSSLSKMTAEHGEGGVTKPYQKERIAAIQSLPELAKNADVTYRSDDGRDPGVDQLAEGRVWLEYKGNKYLVRLLGKIWKSEAGLHDKLHSLAIEDVVVEEPGAAQESPDAGSSLQGETGGGNAGDTGVSLPLSATLGKTVPPADGEDKFSTPRIQTSSPEFKRWFGDSKVVDAEGRPLVAYRFAKNEDAISEGVRFWSRDADYPEAYSEEVGQQGGMTVPAYLRIQNPHIVEMSAREFSDDRAEAPHIRYALENGNDGVVFKNADGEFYVTFKPEQIKSAVGNNGNFDGSNPDIRASTPRIMRAARDKLDEMTANRGVVRELALFANPMSVGGNMDAMAAAHKFANAMRLADHQWITLQDILTKRFQPDELKRMWEAADEENEIRSGRMQATPDKGIDSLPTDQREAVELLHGYATALLQRAKDVGMFQGQGLPYWTPRMAVMVGDDGNFQPFEFGAPEEGGDVRNLRTSSPNLKQRKYETVQEYQAAIKRAAQVAGKHDAEVVADIRTVPFALARLERAIAGRELIEQIKTNGALMGHELVRDHDSGDSNYFTLNHPAFKTWVHKNTWEEVTPGELMNDGYAVQNGTVVDHQGQAVPGYRVHPTGDIEKQIHQSAAKLYVDKSWEGPLRAVLDTKIPAEGLYKSLMHVKAESMNFIMASPLTHQLVIFGRAAAHGIPVVSALQAYYVGHQAENNRALISEMISHGMVPLGHKGFLQDALGIQQQDSVAPGNSYVAKGLGWVADKTLGRDAGDAVRRGIDWAGDKWHNTLLWNRISDLQRGIYIQVKAAAMKDGHASEAAAAIAAHAANRFAGAVPNEAISKGARALVNVSLFSRTFQQANLGMLKDMVVGLPAAQRAALEQTLGREAAEKASNYTRKEMWGAFGKDFVMALVLNNVLQATFANLLKSDDEGDWKDKLANAYAQRYQEMLLKGQESWTNWLNPWFIPNSLSLLAANEPKKEKRIRVGTEDDGTATYMRNPMGKVMEELEAWVRHPVDTVWSKMSPTAKGVIQAAMNREDDYGTPIWKKSDAWGVQVYKGLEHIMEAHIPADVIKAHWNILTGEEAKKDDTLPWFMNTAERQKVFGMWSGMNVSGGNPGGPAIAEMNAVNDEHKENLAVIRKDVKDLVKHGKVDEAFDLLVKNGALPREANNKILGIENPARRAKGMAKTMRFADEYEQARLQNAR